MIPKSVETTRLADKVEKRDGKALGERFWHSIQEKYLLLLLLLVAVLFCEAAWLAFLTPTEADIAHYECYSLTFWLGSHGAALLPQAQCSFLFQHVSAPQAALRMLPLEYPSLTLLPFSLPLLVPLPYYALGFILLMTLAAALIYWLLARSGAWLAAPIFLFYLVLGTAGVAQERFDLLPAACTLICLLAAERGRWRTAYIALALGVLLKLYPIVMLPALFFAEQRAWLMQQEYVAAQGSWLTWAWESAKRWRWRNCLLCVGLLIAVMGGFALLNVQDAIVGPLQYFLVRPPQIESLASSAIWASSSFGAHYTINFDYGSLNLIKSELSSVISPVDTLLTITGILFVFWLQWRKRIDLAQAMVGLVCVLITTGKVFSPQYLIWLIPLLAYLYARGKTSHPWMYCWAAISLLTTVIYVCYYTHLTDPLTDAQILPTLPGFFQLVALRNLLLLGATVAFLCNWWGARSTNKQGDHLG